ncbi:GntR family transcriptional regulator [Streptomyces sp. CJ_13]|uniref:GntR family transcriptional regulator n=1 Tax=Streptomyces sp. CJ_13 TaxID=2724943 RepID=UPI001BDCFD25|nr:GntR family transcriptional regulator [Streptomyces sp. CJ_13]MBT1187239.1 GntR family transcriptional regulator [Streptomyces sp. CJ_13]
MDASTIAAQLRQKIIEGEYPHGSKLPTVRDLAAEHGVSQQTASAVYTALGALGLVRTDARSGTRVAASKQSDAHLGTFTPPDLSVAEAWKPTAAQGTATEETTLVRQLDAPAQMTAWGITEGTTVVERTRIRSVDGVPVQHKMTVMPYEIAAKMPDGYEGTPPMLTPAGETSPKAPAGVRVADWLGWDTARTESVITAEPMDGTVCTALGIPAGAPGFRIVGVTRSSQGGTVFVTITSAQLHHRVTLDIIG